MWMVLDFYFPKTHVFCIMKRDIKLSIRSWKGREIAILQEVIWYLLPWLIFDAIYPRRILPETCPKAITIGMQIICSLLIYDILFFLGHYSFHRFPPFREFHSKHHSSGGNICASDAIKHTFFDGTFDVACSVIALKLTKAHPFSRALYNIIAIYLITEAHSGYDVPWALHNCIPFNIMMGPKAHWQHHAQDFLHGFQNIRLHTFSINTTNYQAPELLISNEK
eukprot:gene4946-9884_t